MAYNRIVFNGNTLIDLTEDDVSEASVLSGVQFHGRDGEVGTGSMNNRGAVSGTISTYNGAYTIPAGYHNGSGTVQISPTEAAKITADNGGNIKAGVTILGQAGSYTGEAPQTQTKSATPSASAQTITPDAGKYLSAVNIAAIPYVESSNTYGTTVTIG